MKLSTAIATVYFALQGDGVGTATLEFFLHPESEAAREAHAESNEVFFHLFMIISIIATGLACVAGSCHQANQRLWQLINQKSVLERNPR